MKYVIATFFIVMSLLYQVNSHAKDKVQSLDKIVAVVNDDIITKSELNRALAIIKMQMTQQQVALPAESVLQKQVLEQLINKKVQLQLAKQAGIRVSDADLDQTIGNIASQNNVSVEVLYQHLHEEGMSTADYRNEMRDQMTLQKLQQQEVISRIVISPQELKSFMHSKTWQDNSNKEYHLQDILIPVSDSPSTEELSKAKKRAEAVLAKLKDGQNFHQIAQSESAGKQALSGGDLGWRKLPEIPSAFADYVVSLQPKGLAGPIQTPNGFHIIRLLSLRSSNAKQESLNTKQIENLLLQRKFEEALQNWISKLRSQSFVVMDG